MLLDSSEAERRPVADRVVRNTRAQTSLSRPGPHVDALRDTFAALTEIEAVNNALGGMISGLGVTYPIGAGHSLLRRRPRPAVEGWADRVDHITATRATDHWATPSGGELPAPAALLVRPDGHVAWLPESAVDPRTASATWFGPDRMGTVEALHRVTAVARAVIGSIAEEQLALPTPCTEWTVRDMLNHIRHGDVLVAASLTGAPPTGTADADYLGAHPQDAVFQGLADTTAALAAPGLLDRILSNPMGDMRVGVRGGDGLIERRVADVFVHLWDLAAATGQSTDLDPELAAIVHAHYRSRLEGVDRSGLGAGRPQPVVAARPVPPDATAADHVAAYLGREVTVSVSGRP